MCAWNSDGRGANLHRLITTLPSFSLYILESDNSEKISVKDMINTKGLFALTEYQQVGWRLTKVENYKNKNDQRHT